MDKIIDLILSSQLIQWALTAIFILITLMLLVLFVQYNIDRVKGRHAKFLWFEVNATQPHPAQHEQELEIPIIHGKNINTGHNYGEIGDRYTGLKQREVTKDDIVGLSNEINEFTRKYASKINNSHITLGFPGCKETTNLANQIYPILKGMGYMKIEICNLQTFGVVGKKFGVSNAPDDSVMIEIYPPDNVE